MESLKLSAVWRQTGSTLAVINDHVVSNGDAILQFRIETFNTLNHPSWGMPSLNILNGAAFPGQPGTNAHQNFGMVNSVQVAMRQLQLGLKYTF